eukprot:15451363-Alexandrium_andersonii.AAC.1
MHALAMPPAPRQAKVPSATPPLAAVCPRHRPEASGVFQHQHVSICQRKTEGTQQNWVHGASNLHSEKMACLL